MHRLVSVISALLPTVVSASVFVGMNDVASKDVATEETETGLVSLGPGAMLYKTGAGTWTVPFGAFGVWNAQTVALKDGCLVVDMSGTSPATAAALPSSVTDKALFWFDAAAYAKTPALFEVRESDGGVFVDKMHDVRETDVESRTRPVAVAKHTFRYVMPGMAEGSSASCATSNNEEKILSPELVTCDGMPAFWFGGVGSGRYMEIWRQGKTAVQDLEDVVHVFMVQNVKEGSGPAFAPGFRSVGVWEGTAARSLNVAMLHTDDGVQLLGNRLYVNGVRKDGLTDPPTKGLSVFDCELTAYKAKVTHLFRNDSALDGNALKIAANDDGSRATAVQQGGGDYVCEMLCFTNRLTGAERQQVVEYLTRKWMPQVTSVRPSVLGAAGTTVFLAGDGELTNVLARTSQSTLVRNGQGTLVFARDPENVSVQYAPTSLADGDVLRLERPAPVVLKAGKGVSATDDDRGAVVTQVALAADKSDRFEKSGRSAILVREVPPSVKRIDVNAGKVVFQPRTLDGEEDLVGGSSEPVLMPVANASFEGRAGGDEAIYFKDITGEYCGWTKLENTEGVAFLYDVDDWPADTAGRNGASRKTWGLVCRPHDGSSAMAIQRDAGIRTVEPLAFRRGCYEMEYWTNSRGQDSQGGVMDILLVDPETRAETWVTRRIQLYDTKSGFGPVRIRFRVPSDCSRCLAFRVPNGFNTHKITVVDDIRLWRIADYRTDSTEWDIPGGDFDKIDPVGKYGDHSYVSNRTFQTTIVHPNWTLVQPEGVAEDAQGVDLGVGFGDMVMNANQSSPLVYYNDWRAPYRSPMLTFLANGARAETTFTPPAGRWYLKADLAENGQSPNGTITAVVTPAGGTSVTLGSVDPNVKGLKTFRFTGSPFVADGKTAFTLSLTYAISTGMGTKTVTNGKRCALYVEDLKLTQTLSDAGSSARWTDKFDEWKPIKTANGGGGGTVSYVGNSSHGTETNGIAGTLGMYIRYDGGVHIPAHDFKRPGTYRISYYQNRLLSSTAVSPLRVWIAQGGVTNQLAVEKCGTKCQRESSCVFRIPEGASYVYDIGFTSLLGKGQSDEAGVSVFDTVLDNITIAPAAEGELLDKNDVFSPDMRIDVAENAMIDLNYVGTNKVYKVRFGGKPVHGVITSETHPRYVSGPGALETEKIGTVILFR